MGQERRVGERLRKFLDRKNISNLPNFTLLYNLSISGNTTEDIVKRFDVESKIYLKDEKAHAIIFSIGINDSRKINRKPVLDQEKFRRNIISLIEKAQKFTPNIVFVGLTPIHPELVQWSEDETYNIEDVQIYNDIISSVCREKNVYFIEIFEKLLTLNYSKLLEDELHYNTKGHQEIFRMIKKFLIQNKIV